MSGSNSVGDFGTAVVSAKIPSASHYPRQGGQPTPVEVWANWFDAAPPQSAKVNVDGACTSMSLGRGSGTNGAWHASLPQLSSACHRYFFVFTDSTGNTVSYPDTGSLGIGASSCPDWTTDRPTTCAAPVPAARPWLSVLAFGVLLLGGGLVLATRASARPRGVA
jgi:hypothetical protein